MQATPAPAQAPSVTQILAPVAGVGPANVYRALKDQRNELQDQLESLEDKRRDLQQALSRDDGPASDIGIEARIKEIDARISALDAQIAQSNGALAKAASVPGAVVPEPRREERTDPAEIVGIISGTSALLLFPIVIAYCRRIWRRGATVIAPVPQDIRDRLEGLASAVDSIGLEVERIGEGQRFITRVMSEPTARAAIGQPVAVPVAVPVRPADRDNDPAPVYRG